MRVIAKLLLNRDRRVREGWWIVAFLALLALQLVPLVLVSARTGREVSIWDQALIIGVATVLVQVMRRKPVLEVTGTPGRGSAGRLGAGLLLGGLLMAVPAGLLWATGAVSLGSGADDPRALGSAVLMMAGVAVAEEMLFRGVLFQRLIAGVGLWPAQVAVGLLFVLTHLGNPGMEGATRLWAGANIFCASLVFGLAFVRTRGLALPIGLHLMANVTQGVLLGFGVSGNAEPSLLVPAFHIEADWLTGGTFGLEASLPGLIAVLVLLAVFIAAGRNGTASAGPGRIGPD